MRVEASPAGEPVEVVALKSVLACELSDIGGAAAIVVLGAALVVRLSTYTLTPSVTVVAQLVENVLELIAVIAIGAQHSEVEHCAQSHIVVESVASQINGIFSRLRK